MRGTVLKRVNKWYCYYYTHRIINGKYERKSKGGFNTKKDAENYLRQKIDEVERTVYTDSRRCTVGAYLTQWLEDYSKNLAQNTINGYRVNIEKHINTVIGDIFLDKLQPSDIDLIFKKMDNQNLSGTTQKYVYAVLRKAFKYAVKRRIIQVNVMDYVDCPTKEKFKPTALNQAQMQTLQQHLKDTDIYIPIILCMSLGLRRGEMLGIRWNDIDFENKTVHIQRSLTPNKNGYVCSNTKTDNSNRVLTLPDFLYNNLLKLRDEQQKDNMYAFDGYINLNEHGDVISASILQKKFKKALNDCKLPDIRIHDLRHSWATLMLQNSIPAKITSEMLGHSGIGITLDIYTHVLTDMQTPAIDVVSNVFK